ncbi:MAG: hypothetical protein LBQ40_00735 [Clostridiales bacterium]|jgi:ABC-2 type transport system permease protein|nr:hypothetical protein [Clostridiales bacterium]
MNTFLRLFRVLLINTYRLDKDQKTNKIIAYAAIGVIAVPIIVAGAAACYSAGSYMAKGGSAIPPDTAANFLSMIFLISALPVMFFGLISMIQVMFFSADAEFLFSLPISPSRVFLAKLLIVYVSELALSAVILVPLTLSFGIGFGADALFYAMLPFAVLILPLIPLLIIALLSFPVMYVVSFLKNKSTAALIVAILAFTGFMSLYIVAASNLAAAPEGDGAIDLDKLLEGALLSFSASGRYFYPIRFLTAAMTGGGRLINSAFFVLSAAAFGALSVFVSSKLYSKSVSAQIESAGGGAKTSARRIAAAGRETKKKDGRESLLRLLIIKDFKMLSRDTGFAFQCFAVAFICPVMVFLYSSMLSGTAFGDTDGELSIMSTAIPAFLALLFCGANYTAHAAFTREGKFFYINKYLPVPYSLIVKSKILFANIVSAVSAALTVIALFAASLTSGLGLGLALINGVLLLAAVAPMSYALNRMGIFRDLKKPKLDWNNAREALKSNTYIMFPMLISGVASFAGFLIGIIAASVAAAYVGEVIAYLIFWVPNIAVSAIVFVVFGAKKPDEADVLFERLEV